MALNDDADPAGGALDTIMKTFSILAVALIAATPALAQPGNLPFGNPLGDTTTVIIPETPAPDAFAERDAAIARAQALSAWRSRQAALLESARPMPGANAGAGSYVDYGRIGAQQQAQQGADAPPAQRGPVPTPFGGGITSIIGGGIRPAWDRR